MAKPPPGMGFEYASDFDENGILFHLGTGGALREWRNPEQARIVAVSTGGGNYSARTPSHILARDRREDNYFSHYFELEFLGGVRVCPTKYTLRNGGGRGCCITAWELHGRNDGGAWTRLDSREDDTFAKAYTGDPYSTATFDVQHPSEEFFSSFKFRQLANRICVGDNSCYIGGFELYGDVSGVDEQWLLAQHSAPSHPRPRDHMEEHVFPDFDAALDLDSDRYEDTDEDGSLSDY
eukprot:m.86351 g.86351  ORF g.86351 m.86351 type:complete len:237 (-) comp14873_c0_seq1:74-784(-)